MRYFKVIMKKTILFLVMIMVIVLIGCSSQSKDPKDPLDINLKEHKNVALHIHPTLEIEILGQRQSIPANIGITNAGMRIVHTHDSSGKLHVESPKPIPVYLGNFFTIWGKDFSRDCIFDKCVDEDHTLEMFVNGAENSQFDALLMQDGDQIKIVYSEK
jgi:hypothetical protein